MVEAFGVERMTSLRSMGAVDVLRHCKKFTDDRFVQEIYLERGDYSNGER